MQDISDQIAESKEQIEAIQPSTPERRLKFNLVFPDDVRREYDVIQGELGMFPVQEFVTLMTGIIDDFAKGKYGIKIGELFRGEIKTPDQYTPDEVEKVVDENSQLIAAFLEAVKMLPGLQKEIICLSLGIEPRQREWFKGAISRAPSQGGLTVDEGFDLLIWFLRQNAKLVRRFFEEKGRELVDEFRLQVLGETLDVEGTATETTEESDSPGSTPSSTSSQDTLVSV